jgi:plasmid stabilization system protein ParE
VIVRLTPEARDDLVAVWLWIARDDEKTADAFVGDLERACASLVPRPSRFPVALNLDWDPVALLQGRGRTQLKDFA